MAITHTTIGTTTSATGVTSLDVSLPLFQVNDLFLLWLHWPDAITAQSLPAGWTQQVALTAEGTTSKAALYSRIAQAGDIGPTITWTTSSKPIFTCGGWRGVNTTTPITGAGIVADTTSSLTVVVGAVTNTGTGVEWAAVFGAFRTSTSTDKAGAITAASSGLTLLASSNNSGAASSPWAIDGVLDSSAAVAAGSHSYTLGTSGIATAAAHKISAIAYLNPAGGAAPAVRPKAVMANQAVFRGLTRCQKLTRRRSGLFVPAEWDKKLVTA